MIRRPSFARSRPRPCSVTRKFALQPEPGMIANAAKAEEPKQQAEQGNFIENAAIMPLGRSSRAQLPLRARTTDSR